MERRRTRLLVVVSVLVAALASSIAAASDRTAVSDRKLQQALDRVVGAGAPGAIALARVGDRTVRLTSGYGNVQPRRPIRASDRFRVGSVTKTFVATVVLQLVGEGKLSLGDTVERWLPGLVPNGSAITVRQLLNMTSGLFDYLDDGDPTVLKPYLQGNFGYVWKPRKLVEIAVSHRPKFAPGAGWSYCNTCYILLGLIVETVTDHPIGNELRRRIFAPLRLRGTSFDSQPRIAGRHAHGYERDRNQLVDVSVLSPSFGWAAGAIVSTADDLANFYRALLRGRLLRPDLLQTMQTTVAADPAWRYGLGLIGWPLPCGIVWGHGGDTAGYYALAFSSRDGKRQLVLLANAGSDTLSQRGYKAAIGVLATAHCG
jgi:D-alanyl-D-alanine carboxypeptidase